MAIPTALRDAVVAWRSATATAISHRFAATLDKAIPALMDRSEQAQHNSLQIAYFHAQQELGRQRDTVQRRFDEALAARISVEPSAAQGKPPPSAGELKLVNPDTFERLVVLQTLADRADQNYHAVLHELRHRLSALYRGAAFQRGDIPASPKQLLDSFDDATHKLDIDQTAWQALAAVFDVTLLRTLQPDFDTLNDTLRNAGILPNLKPGPVMQQAKQPKRPPEGTPDNSGTAKVEVEVARDVEQIRALIGHASPTPSVGEMGRMQAAQIADLIESRQEQLVRLLPEHGVFGAGLSANDIGRAQLDDSRQAMRQQRAAIKQQVGRDQLSRFDASTIDIIGALFEAVLKESDLCAPIKALLSHLHTPYLKLAMREPDLLTNPGHPARQLLDEMVRAGETWGDSSHLGQGVFPMLKELVGQLREGATPSRPQLEKLRAQLLRHTGELRRRRDQRGERATEAEIGRAKLDDAKRVAAEHVRQLVDETLPCEPCKAFFTGPWHDYLTLLLVRNDGRPGGDGWAGAQALGDQIARLSGAMATDTRPSLQTLDALKVHLHNSLGHLIPHYRQDIDALMIAMRRHRDTPAVTPAATPPAPKPVPSQPLSRKGEQLCPPLNDQEHQLVDQLRKSTPGAVYRFHSADEQPARLLTVTWFNPNTDRLMFVDQRGAKAELLSVQRLARLIHQDMAYAVDETIEKTPFVTRALKKLREYLESNRWITPESSI